MYVTNLALEFVWPNLRLPMTHILAFCNIKLAIVTLRNLFVTITVLR